jgi:NitT/TauT family transport system substrate-binding protein
MNSSGLRALAVLGACFCIGCSRAPASKQSGRTEIRLGAARGSLFYLPVFVGGPAGCFEKQELTVKIEETKGNSLVALVGGSLEVVASGYLQVLDLVSQGRPLRAFVLMQQFPGFAAIVSPRASRPIHAITDLKGLNIGVASPGSESHRILNYILRQHGMRPEDINVIGLGTGTMTIPALERGKVDVMLAQGNTITFLERQHPDLVILFDTRTPDSIRAALGVQQMPGSVLLAHENWLRSNPGVARRLAAAVQCTLGWIQDHTPQEIWEALPAANRSPDSAADLDGIANSKNMLSRTGEMTQAMHEAAVRVSGIASQTNLERAYTNEYLKR